jgi:hypothetical protein
VKPPKSRGMWIWMKKPSTSSRSSPRVRQRSSPRRRQRHWSTRPVGRGNSGRPVIARWALPAGNYSELRRRNDLWINFGTRPQDASFLKVQLFGGLSGLFQLPAFCQCLYWPCSGIGLFKAWARRVEPVDGLCVVVALQCQRLTIS